MMKNRIMIFMVFTCLLMMGPASSAESLISELPVEELDVSFFQEDLCQMISLLQDSYPEGKAAVYQIESASDSGKSFLQSCLDSVDGFSISNNKSKLFNTDRVTIDVHLNVEGMIHVCGGTTYWKERDFIIEGDDEWKKSSSFFNYIISDDLFDWFENDADMEWTLPDWWRVGLENCSSDNKPGPVTVF